MADSNITSKEQVDRLSDIDLRELIRAYEAQRNPTPMFSDYVIVCLRELQERRVHLRLNGQALEHTCPCCKEKLFTMIPPELRSHHETEDECAPYLKDGETHLQCIERNRADANAVLTLLAREKYRTEEACRLLKPLADCDPAIRAWLKAADLPPVETSGHVHTWHPDGYCTTCPMQQPNGEGNQT